MSEEDPAVGLTATSDGPAESEASSLGSDGDGADADGQDGSQDAEIASTDPESTETDSDSDDDALTQALTSGKTDDLDAEGNAKKAKPEVKKPAAPKADEAKEPEGDKPPEETPKAEDADPEEQALLEKARTKGDRKELDKLFKERRELRPAKAFADALIQHATDAGLVSQSETGLNTQGLHQLIEQEKFLKTRTKDQQAAYFRSLADSIAPLPKAVEPTAIPQEVQDAVDAGYLSAEEAQVIAEKRAPKPEAKKELAKEPEKTVEAKATGPAPEAIKQGYDGIAEVCRGYQTQHKADWGRIEVALEKRLAPLITKASPDLWKDLAEMACKAVIADLRPATKTPTSTTRPAPPPPKKDVFLTEAEEADALAKGRSF